MKLLCDQMLIRLGQWLRAAGYDTAIAKESVSDEEIAQQAKEENRIIITRDRQFIGNGCQIIYLNSNTLQECVQELSSKLEINWMLNPFSRCLLCNKELIIVDKDKAQSVPQAILNMHAQIYFCQNCQKFYWLGSHTKNMLHQLQIWNLAK